MQPIFTGWKRDDSCWLSPRKQSETFPFLEETEIQGKERRMRTGKDQEPLFALDIGTRSLVGVVGYPEKDKIRVKAIETLPHRKRAMRDGQIEDIHAVARGAAEIKRKLEERLGCTLPRVYVAAAGRALKTCHAAFETESDQKQRIDQETISRLEAGAIANAEEKFRGEGDKDIFYLVGYSVSRYYLDNYPICWIIRGGKYGQRL